MAFQPPTPADIDRAVKAWFAAAPPLATGLGSAETFADIEQLAARIGRSVACHLTKEALQEQAPEVGTETPCPQCGRACRVTRHPRRLITVAGEVSYAEPASHCESCRRDFFSRTVETASG
jgi:anaerobic selenocysteine-containing dehydrogenase